MKILKTISFLIVLTIISCASNKEQVDLVIKNAKIYTVNDAFGIVEAIAIHDGKIIFTGTTQELSDKFQAKETIDAKNQFVYPGFYDAHAHLYSLGINMQTVNLRNTKSFDEVVQRVVAFQNDRKTNFIKGRGWDQNDWTTKEFPSREKLDELFPHVPVVLTRIDGHAMLVNAKALELAGITPQTKIEGGQVEVIDGKTTGILVDNAMDLVSSIVPEPNKKTKIQALIDAQRNVFNYGITTINEAG